MAVTWAWQGAVTSTTAVVKAKVDANSRLIVSTHADFSAPVATIGPIVPSADGLVAFPITGLSPLTTYFWVIEVGGVNDATKTGILTTFPTEGTPTSFTFALGSCAGGQGVGSPVLSNHVIFDIIRQHNPAFFLHMGDLHYEDPNSTDVNVYRGCIDDVLAQSNQARLYREVPLAYMHSDHEIVNDFDRTSTGIPAWLQIYQERTPHYPLLMGETGTVAPYQEFVYGRTRFFLTDNRCFRDPSSTADSSAKTRLGSAQKAFFKSRLLAAREPLLVWQCESPWVAPPRKGTGGDDWGYYAHERDELAQFFVDHNLHKRMVIVAGDLHALAYDTGLHNRYKDCRIPSFNVAALDRQPFSYAGPFESGLVHQVSTGDGQYGLMTITDNGGPSIGLTFSGRQVTP